MPLATRRTSAPRRSQMAAISLMKLTRVASMALLAYLIISAVRRSVMMIGASRPRYRPATASAAARSSPPRTTRSGAMKSLSALPSARNSGLETTAKLTAGRALRRHVARHHLAQAGLEERHLTVPQHLNLGGVDIHADDAVAQLGEARARREPDVARPHHRNPLHVSRPILTSWALDLQSTWPG